MYALVRERKIRKLYWAPLEVSESHTVFVTLLVKSDEMNLLGIDLSSFWATQDFFVSTEPADKGSGPACTPAVPHCFLLVFLQTINFLSGQSLNECVSLSLILIYDLLLVSVPRPIMFS